MKENEKCCATCADFVDSKYSCKHWERIGKPEE